MQFYYNHKIYPDHPGSVEGNNSNLTQCTTRTIALKIKNTLPSLCLGIDQKSKTLIFSFLVPALTSIRKMCSVVVPKIKSKYFDYCSAGQQCKHESKGKKKGKFVVYTLTCYTNGQWLCDWEQKDRQDQCRMDIKWTSLDKNNFPSSQKFIP